MRVARLANKVEISTCNGYCNGVPILGAIYFEYFKIKLYLIQSSCEH